MLHDMFKKSGTKIQTAMFLKLTLKKTIKFLFPTLAIVIMGVTFFPNHQHHDIPPRAHGAQVAKLRYTSTTTKGDHIELQAQKGSATDANSITLDSIAGTLSSQNGQSYTLQAKQGKFNQSKHKVTLKGNVELQGPAGISIQTSLASVDMKTGKAFGNQSITAKHPNGQIKSDSFEVNQNSQEITFKGNPVLVFEKA